MQETMRLMQSGDLDAATRAIQRGMNGRADPTNTATKPGIAGSRTDWIQGEYRVLRDVGSGVVDDPGTCAPADGHRLRERDGQFRDARFTCNAGAMDYKLFIPIGLEISVAPPLVVMLHGCTQSPDDFARGTRMNALAQENGYVVAYPAQSKDRNPSKCWNWFRSEHQRRDQGEPAIIAALTGHLVKTHGLDARRVFAAGLSSGGAMAVVLASSYADVYAAIGVHSGLPFGAAHDLPSAFAAMKQGVGAHSTAVPPGRMRPVPAIVFHGDRDATVNPRNGAAVVEQCLGEAQHMRDAVRETVESGSVQGGRTFTRTTFQHSDDSVAAEEWVVHGAGHAWFGGDPAGSYTDPSGPDASAHMLRFFSACARSAVD